MSKTLVSLHYCILEDECHQYNMYIKKKEDWGLESLVHCGTSREVAKAISRRIFSKHRKLLVHVGVKGRGSQEQGKGRVKKVKKEENRYATCSIGSFESTFVFLS